MNFNFFNKPPKKEIEPVTFPAGGPAPEQQIPHAPEKPKSSIEDSGVKNKFLMLLLALGVAMNAEGSAPALSSFENFADMHDQAKKVLVELREKMNSLHKNAIEFFSEDGKKIIVSENGSEMTVTGTHLNTDLSTTEFIITDADNDALVDHSTLKSFSKDGKISSDVSYSFKPDPDNLGHVKMINSNIDLTVPQTDKVGDIKQDDLEPTQKAIIEYNIQKKFTESLANGSAYLDQLAKQTAQK